MSIATRGDRLACTRHVDGSTRIYLTNRNCQKKRVGGDDSFFVAIPFSEENSRATCRLIAECQGLHAKASGQGMGGSFLFDLV